MLPDPDHLDEAAQQIPHQPLNWIALCSFMHYADADNRCGTHMKKPSPIYTRIVACLLLLCADQALAEGILVAAASNFTDAIKHIAGRFEAQSGHKVTLIFGSTGKHYAQIRNGAPFDAFFAADFNRPKLLEDEGLALPGSRFTYAIGRIILWSPNKKSVDPQGRVLEQKDFRYLAIANPKLAPYGRAAREILQSRGIWNALTDRMVRGENVGQAFQFVKSGNAQLGFVAYSQVKRPGHPIEGSFWEVPQSLYSPIVQQAVLLKNSDAARSFLSFVKSDEIQLVIRGFGYGIP